MKLLEVIKDLNLNFLEGMKGNRVFEDCDDLNEKWVEKVINIDWKQKKQKEIEDGGKRVIEKKREIMEIMDREKKIGINEVIFKVQKKEDEFYK